MSVPEVAPAHYVISDGAATPIEFTFRGKRFRIHAVLSRWCEAGGWWNRVSDGIYRPDDWLCWQMLPPRHPLQMLLQR